MSENPQPVSSTTRREFLLLTAATAAICGCQSAGKPGSAPTGAATGRTRNVDAGPAAGYKDDGVYSSFRDLGFFIIRSGGKLVALSSVCTHRDCKLTAETDHSFYCNCHGSTFDPTGKVTEGPAKRDLPLYPTFTDANGHLIVMAPV